MTSLRASLRRRLLSRSKATAKGPRRRPPGDLLVTAPKVQQGFWCMDQLAPGCGVANVSRSWRIDGDFEPDRCHQALIALTEKHDCLRCGLHLRDGALQMAISEQKDPDFAQVDLRQPGDMPSCGEAEKKAEAIMATESLRAFDLGADPLLRLRAYRVGDQVWLLHLVYHHAIMDGWSVGQFCEELGQLYGQSSSAKSGANTGANLSGKADRPPYDFADYARDLQQRPQGAAVAQNAAALAPLPELSLPFDFAPPTQPSYGGKSTPLQIGAQTWSALEALAESLHVSPISVLLAAFRLALFEMSGQRDFYLGNTAMTRNGPGVQRMLGAFVDTLPIRTPLAQGAAFAQVCKAEQAALAQTLEQALAQGIPQGGAVAAEQMQAPALRFQAVLNYRGFSTRNLLLPGCEVHYRPVPNQATPFPLALNLEKTPQGCAGELAWNAARFTAATAARIVELITATLDAGLQDPKAPIEALLRQVRAREGRSRVLSCDAVAPSPPVGELLARAFDHYGDQPALRCGELRWSYGDLDRASAAWARTLVQAPGSVGDLVALALPRGADFVAALIGILRAGRAFVPLSPQDPPERLKRILQQAAPKHLIAQADLAQALELPALKPEEAAKAAAPFADLAPESLAPEDLAPEDLAYVMFTSGSTGTPKGVAVPHRALANYLAAVGQVFAPRSGDRLLSTSATTFDSIIYEVLLPLGTGGELVMIEEDLRRDPWHIVECLRDTAPHHFFATPSLWRMLLQAGLPDMPQLTALAGGEALPPRLAAQILPRVGRLYNVYGPTEATVFSTWQEVLPQTTGDSSILPVGSPIGQPFPGYRLAVVDPSGQPVWPGRLGEIWIAGAGVATGYYKSPARTAQSFPLATSLGAEPERWYRTGDQGRLRGDGTLSYAGRLDDQLKISGQRVEPGEIENLLVASDYATGAAVFAATINDKSILVAFYLPQKAATETAVRRYLQANLPSAWVPGLVAQCDALPLTSSGKLDRRALQRRAKTLFASRFTSRNAADAPELNADCCGQGGAEGGIRAELAPAILQGWQQALGQPPASDDQDFFAAGGNSLRLITLLARIRELTSCHLPVAEAFASPTPRGLQALLAKTAPLDLHQALVCTKAGSGPDPLVFLPGLVPTGPNLTDMMAQAPQDLNCYLMQRPVAAALATPRSFADHTRYYARVLDHSYPEAKLHLTGFSYGGAEAFETARQLAALGFAPASLTVIDHGPVFRRLWPVDPTWGGEAIRAEKRRRAHVFAPWAGDMTLVRGDRPGLLSLAMIAQGWEDFVEGEVAVHMVPATHDEMLHQQAAATLQAVLGQQPPDCIVAPQPGAADRRRVSHLLAKGEPEAALDLICGISREHPNHPWAALVADQLALDMGKECTDMLADWIETADLLPPKGVPALAWHGARAQALLRLQDPQAALAEVEIARASASTHLAGKRIRELEVIYAELLQQVDRMDEATAVLVHANKLGATRSDISIALGICLAKQGKFHRALSLLAPAKDTKDCTPDLLFWLAQAEQGLQAEQGAQAEQGPRAEQGAQAEQAVG
ncbi:amino acid adenylation domain-containing protein [Pseudophaeobacter sp. TrK17]|uniref:amino acid adenylation domain-containing protein n=1 Tax=Pseudophaeobacter sp. TrK17 TaxID=2815167 RepID=UPI0035D04A77